MGGPPPFTITQRQPPRRPRRPRRPSPQKRASLPPVTSRPPIPRWLALAAFLALVTSAALTAWSVLTNRADFSAATEQPATPQSNEAEEHPAAGTQHPDQLGALATEEEIK